MKRVILVMPVPTPQPGVSQLFEDLANFTRKPSPQENERVRGVTNKGVYDNQLQKNIAQGNSDAHVLSSPINRSLFSAPRKFSHIHRSLASIHNAKSHVYSFTFF